MKTKILAVDDNPDILFSIKDGLETIEPSMEVTGVSSGKECLEKAGQVNPDIILMDIMMPAMDGWEVVAQLRKMQDVKDVPIVFLTGKTDDLSKSMGSIASEDYIEKPFKPEDLRDRIRKVLERHGK